MKSLDKACLQKADQLKQIVSVFTTVIFDTVNRRQIPDLQTYAPGWKLCSIWQIRTPRLLLSSEHIPMRPDLVKKALKPCRVELQIATWTDGPMLCLARPQNISAPTS